MKYEPLARFLRTEAFETRSLSFNEVEAILGAPLPPSARCRPEWWSNNPTGHVNAQAWLGAGYKTEGLDLAGETVVFRREAHQHSFRRHPAFGALAGTVRVMPGVDLTEPADPDWAGLYD
jgi:hypothetical protein